MNWKSQLLSKQELDFIKESGYTIRVKWISPAEGFEYRISLMGDEEVLAYRKSARAAFNFIMRLKRRG